MEATQCTLIVLAGLTLLIACHAAPIADTDASLVSQILKKTNIVLDNIIARQHAQTADINTHEEAEVELQQRNEDLLVTICKEFAAVGIVGAGCVKIENQGSNVPIAERSFNAEELARERKASGSNMIREICELFAQHGIVPSECGDYGAEAEKRTSLRQTDIITGLLHNADDTDSRAERSYEDMDDTEASNEISEPEPAPRSLQEADTDDISLEKVLRYLQYLRKSDHNKRERD